MVRHRLHTTITLGSFNDALQWARDINAVCNQRGWTGFRVLVPSFGAVNQFILEAEYPDHAAFFRENEAFQSDAAAMSVYRRGIELVAPGTHPWDELEETAPLQIA
jgi:hypothetical protein